MDQLTLDLMRNFGETLGLDEAVTQMFGGPLYLTFVCGYHVVLDFCMWVSCCT